MWILKQGDSITQINKPKAMTINTIQHPRNIFTCWSEEELRNIGIYPVRVVDNLPSEGSTYYNSSSSLELVDNVYVKTITYTPKELLGENGLLTRKLVELDTTANQMLAPTDWYIIRNSETGANVSANVLSYRSNVREYCNSIQSQLANCNTITSFATIVSSIQWPDS